jgi:SUR7/PalI family
MSTLFTLLASITATALFATLDGTLNTSLKEYQIHSTLGGRILAVTWIAVALSIGSGLFWALSSCCCSGQSRTRSTHEYPIPQKTPYMYERVQSPYMGGGGTQPEQTYLVSPVPQAVPPMAQTAYEPFRHSPLEDGA